MKTVVLGGYGNFGKRICLALAINPEIELHIAGRDLAKAKSLAAHCSALHGNPAHALKLDYQQNDFSQALRTAGAELVIHTAGPFQQQGYQVAQAVAKAGAHYIDLADGRRFVCDFAAALDAPFRAAGKLAITGASTVPALSSAVIDELTRGWQRIDDIDYCIGPAQTAPRGIATMAAVLGYAGQAIPVWQGGRWQTEYGWANPTRVEFARMRPRRGAVCDIPDLELFPQHYPGVRSVVFRAALEVGIGQSMFALLAQLRRWGIIHHPENWAGLLNRSANAFDWLGSALGGMVLRVSGLNQTGQAVKKAWHITADHDHGPEIPVMAAILLARQLGCKKTTDGEGDYVVECGAYTATSRLPLAAFEPEFAKWHMITEIIDES